MSLYIETLLFFSIKTSIDWVNIQWIDNILWLNRKFIRFRFWKEFTDYLSEFD